MPSLSDLRIKNPVSGEPEPRQSCDVCAGRPPAILYLLFGGSLKSSGGGASISGISIFTSPGLIVDATPL
jgi:hypothetical protein